MIFNCPSCCKAISTKKELCPYCKSDVSEVGLMLEKRSLQTTAEGFPTLAARLKGSIAVLKF